METAFNIFDFVVFAALWVGFAYLLITSQGSLDAAWRWITGLALLLQAVVWLLFLPVVLVKVGVAGHRPPRPGGGHRLPERLPVLPRLPSASVTVPGDRALKGP